MAEKTDTKIFDWGFKILSSLIVPVLIWALSLQTTVSKHERDLDEIRRDAAEMESTKETTRQNSLAWTRLEEAMKRAEERLDDIKETVADIKRNSN